MSQSKSILKDKSFSFAIAIVKTYKNLVEEKREYVMSKQLLRSGHLLEQIFEKLKMLKVPTTLFINWVSLKRSVMKHCIGSNYSRKLNI
jgi:hypothetical protein